MQSLINGGLITGLFLVAVAIATGLFARAKNRADAVSSIAEGARVVVDMSVDEIQRKDAKIVVLHARLNRMRAYARDLAYRLTIHGHEVPPFPSAMTEEDDD
jgi:hypothetical protein